MYLLYSLLLYLSVPAVLLRLLWRSRGNPGYRRRWGERFGYVAPLAPGGPVIWIHAVSVGEVSAAKPLVEYLARQYPGRRLLLSTTTPTGAETARRLFNGIIEHRYFPYDLPGAVRRFLKRTAPELVIILETEIWPNLYRCCRRRGIPVALVNARLSEKSARGYRRFPGLVRRTLESLALIAAQSRADADRLRSLGAPSRLLRVTGNLKFDVSPPHSVAEAGEGLRRFLSPGRTVWLAASTHAGEEELCLRAFREVLAGHGDCLLILAPRHPERSRAVLELARRDGFKPVRHSERGAYTVDTRVYVLDTLGELPVFYAAADVSFIGGSLVAVGGHNVLEPAALGVPVICGPHLFNFSEAAGRLEEAGALCRVSTVTELARTVDRLLDDANLRHALGEQGRRVVLENQGSLQRLLQALSEADLLPPGPGTHRQAESNRYSTSYTSRSTSCE